MVPTKDMLDQIAKEEAELVLDQFTEEDAWELGRRTIFTPFVRCMGTLKLIKLVGTAICVVGTPPE